MPERATAAPDGHRLHPAAGRARRLVLLLHGYGADGADLIEIGRALAPWLPDTAFFAPHAPRPCGQGGGGREWFPLTFRDPHERWRGVQAAAPGLEAVIDRELARLGLTGRDLALVGFSQGSMMALHVGLRRPDGPAALVGLSGLLVQPEGGDSETFRAELRSRPPILLAHGDGDDIIPVEALFASAEALAACDRPCQWHLSIGVGHGIDEGALRHAGLFLVGAFGLPPPRA